MTFLSFQSQFLGVSQVVVLCAKGDAGMSIRLPSGGLQRPSTYEQIEVFQLGDKVRSNNPYVVCG